MKENDKDDIVYGCIAIAIPFIFLILLLLFEIGLLIYNKITS